MRQSLLNIIAWFKNRLDVSKRNPQPHRVSIEGDVIIGEYHDRTVRIDLSKVTKIEAITTDEGPWSEDLYYFFSTAEDRFVIASEMAGIGEMIDRIESLPMFNKGELRKAIGSTTNKMFLLWQGEDPST